MSGYTPTTDDMRTSWHRNSMSYGPGERAAEFDRFIAKIKADALREAAEESEQITCEGHGGDDWFPSERVGQVAVWLDVRADLIEGAIK